MRAESSKSHLGFLDGVRGLAAIYVVLHHAAMNVPQASHAAGALTRAVYKATRLGHYSVDLFIVLSGYCLMLPVARDGGLGKVSVFLQRRALRILPPYYASALVTLLLIATVIGHPTGTHWDVSIPVVPMDLVTHLLLVHEWFERTSPKISHVYWSVGVEWKIYLLFPLLCLGWRRFGPIKTALFAIVLSYGVWSVLLLLDVLNPTPWGSSLYYVGLFTMGMLGADAPALMLRARRAWQGRLNLMFWALGALVVASTILLRANDAWLPWRGLFVGAWATALLVGLRARKLPSPVMVICSSRPCRWLGEIGYSLYLMHAPALQLVYVLVLVPLGIAAERAGFWAMLVLGTAASILVAFAFYRLVEYPFHRLSRRRGRALNVAVVAAGEPRLEVKPL